MPRTVRALVAAAIVIVVIFLFLGNLRSTFIPIVTIPLSLIGVMIALMALGYSINLLTLLALVLAILGRHGRVGTGGADVFVNVVGGVRVDEPGCDLAVALAVASASRGVPLMGTPRACFGELGLTGELRWVGHPERRLEEAAKHGCTDVIAPPDSAGGACEATTLREALALARTVPERRFLERRIAET